MSIKMIATRRYYRAEDRKEYGVGEGFTVGDDREADKLERVRKAARAPGDAKKSNPTDLPAPSPAPVQDDIVALRNEYETVVGKRPFPGWKVKDLKERMAEYQRRDLTSANYSTTALRAED